MGNTICQSSTVKIGKKRGGGDVRKGDREGPRLLKALSSDNEAGRGEEFPNRSSKRTTSFESLAENGSVVSLEEERTLPAIHSRTSKEKV